MLPGDCPPSSWAVCLSVFTEAHVWTWNRLWGTEGTRGSLSGHACLFSLFYCLGRIKLCFEEKSTEFKDRHSKCPVYRVYLQLILEHLKSIANAYYHPLFFLWCCLVTSFFPGEIWRMGITYVGDCRVYVLFNVYIYNSSSERDKSSNKYSMYTI